MFDLIFVRGHSNNSWSLPPSPPIDFWRIARFLALALIAVLLLLACTTLVFAAASAPETVAQSVSENTKVTWAWGEAAQAVASAILSVLSMVALYFFRKLPENIIAIIGNSRVETLLANARSYALNAVAGASRDKSLSVDVGNQVLAEALTYALQNGSSWLISWGGGPEGLAKKLLGRLNLPTEFTANALPAIVDNAVATTKAA